MAIISWTEERIQAFILLWQQGHTMLAIGNQLKVPRNAIAGIAFRLRQCGLIQYRITPNRSPQTKEEKAKKQRHRRRKTIEARPRPIIMPRTKPEPIVPRIPDIPKPVTEGVTILARKTTECAYPIGHRLFCGAPTCSMPDELGNMLPTSWCEYHWIVCHRKGKAA